MRRAHVVVDRLLEGEPAGFVLPAEGLVERNAGHQVEQDFVTLKAMVEARSARGGSSETDTP